MYNIGWFFGGRHFHSFSYSLQTYANCRSFAKTQVLNPQWLCVKSILTKFRRFAKLTVAVPDLLWPMLSLALLLLLLSHSCPCPCICCCCLSSALSLSLWFFLVLFLVLALVLSLFHVFFRIDVTWLYRSHPAILSCTTPLYQIRSSSHIASTKSPER